MVKRMIAGILLVLGIGLFLPGCKGDAQMRQKIRQEVVMEKLDKLAEGLNLNKDQQVKFDALKTKVSDRMTNFGKDRESFKTEMLAEMDKETPDINLIANKAKDRIDTASQRGKEWIDLTLEFYNILDKDQQKVLIKKIQKKIDALQTLQEN